MTELDRFIRDYDGGGSEGVARMLLAEPRFEGFNVLWKQPSHLYALIAHFGLAPLADAEAFAASLLTVHSISAAATLGGFTAGARIAFQVALF